MSIETSIETSDSPNFLEYMNQVPNKSSLEKEMEQVYRMYLKKCDHVNNIQIEIDTLQKDVAYQEKELQKANNDIMETINKYSLPHTSYIIRYNNTKTDAVYHNLSEIFHPSVQNISSINKMTPTEISCVVRTTCSNVCTGDIVYVGSHTQTRKENGFAIMGPDNKLIFHNDLMTMIFDKSINSYYPVPYDFIKDRNIKYGKMFQYIVENKKNPIGEVAYNCGFNNWRTNEEVEKIIKYYIEKDVWM